ncbi:MAG: FtsL-like putative cell division protein [Cytophagales bacterium]
MATNRPKDAEIEESEHSVEKKKLNLSSILNKVFGMEKVFVDGIPMEKVNKAIFLSVLALLYIANSHMADKTVRKIDKLKKEVEDLRADYITLKAGYMFDSKQSEVAKKVEHLGLVENKRPPFKLVIDSKDIKDMPF